MFLDRHVNARESKRILVRFAKPRPLILVAILLTCCLCAFAAQQGSSSAANTPAPNSVRVVVRDAAGNPVTGLTHDDFRLLVDKKPRQIVLFDSPSNSQPYYVLGFTPDPAKRDAKSPAVTVELASNPSHYTVEAHVGDVAPTQSENAPAPAPEKDPLTHAIFNPQPVGAVPVQFHIQYAKMEADKTQITLIIGVDLHSLRFHKDGADNVDDLHYMVGIFDVHGNDVAGQKKTITLRLTDPQLQQMVSTGATFSVILDAKPGDYQCRVALMDAGSQQLQFSSQSLAVP
jgi:hypothetical protein